MVNLDNAVVARYKKEGKHFEILIDSDNAIAFRDGKNLLLDDVVLTTDIFIDSKKATKPTDKDLQIIFNTLNKEEICKFILKHGEIQLTAEHQRKIRENKRKQIVNLIHRNAIDAKTGLPHPTTRIENAMNEAKINIDTFKSAEIQVQDVIKKLREILPIKYEIREIWIRVPAQYGAQSFKILKQFGKLLKEEWQGNGDLIVVIEIPAGLTEDLFDDLNKLTRGNIESKILTKK